MFALIENGCSSSLTPLLPYSLTPLLPYSLTPLLPYSLTPLLIFPRAQSKDNASLSLISDN
ncbi:hypothetical protein F9K91_12210 [Brucella tritici]|uniref:Uncharacterized protein n=1 Tax=Brucella tritici TaxID=94626 RepID=A0A833CM60_9HYPH|nr:hypothetical protein F9K91_12210 [Brucella tritici]